VSGVEIRDNPAAGRYEAFVDDAPAGIAAYRRSPGLITFTHTEVDEAFEGRGVGGALAQHSLDAARAAGESVQPICPFYRSWIGRHPDYQDLVAH
jgi:uncharacterized protein